MDSVLSMINVDVYKDLNLEVVTKKVWQEPRVGCQLTVEHSFTQRARCTSAHEHNVRPVTILQVEGDCTCFGV